MNSTLQILFVSARYPPLVGGTEIHTAEVAKRLVERGHDVTVLTTDTTHMAPFEEIREGVRVLSVPAWPRSRDWYVAPAVADVLRDEPRDLLHVQGYHTAVAPVAMASAVRHRKPFVLTFHSGGHSSRLRRAFRPVQRVAMTPLLRHARRLIGVSDFETELFERSLRLPSSMFVTIPNGSSFDPVRIGGSTMSSGATDRVERPVSLVSVGRLERYKGFERVIDALPSLVERLGEVHYTIVGNGPDRARLEERARRRGVDHLVEFRSVPADRRDELADLFTSASLFVLMSDYESQGLAVLEARACGVPILVAATSALADLADQPGVWAVPPRSRTSEVADAIGDIVRAPRHDVAVDLPTWDDITDRLVDVYGSVLGRGGA